MDWPQVYRWGGVLRMDVGRMTLWEFSQYVQGYLESKGAKPKGGTISDDRLAAMGVVGF